MADYSEILMQSMDILVNKRLSELQFDKTISCQITDTSAADRGEYIVSDGSTAFTAYSKDVTFKQGDTVYVTIPNGDFNNQKQIIGKYVGPDESLNYLSPLDAYVDITGDLCNFTGGASLLANREDVKTESGLTEFHSKKTIWKAKIQNGKGFERLGIKADFKTWLKSFNTNGGNFGLCLYVKYVDKSNVNTSDSEKIAQFIFDSDSMYGNSYNFNTFFTQEKVFDISHIKGQITDMELVFYQDFNFTDVNGVKIPTKDINDNWLIDNIYVNNIHIGLGYDITKFNDDKVLVYCLNEPTYNYNNLTQENRKTLQVRWVRVTNEGIYSIDSEKEIPENAAIHWYRYEVKIQDEVDELAGPMWFEIEEGLNKLQIDVDPNVNELSQLYKVIVEIPSAQWIEQKLDADYNIDYSNLQALANEGETEEIRDAAAEQLASYESEIRSQRKIYESETIEFKSEVPVVDKMTADLINGLKIVVDEKGYKGNYMLYNASNKITNINEATKMRVMRATYKSLVTGDTTLDGAESIIWKIPLTSTMIYPPENGKEYKTSDSDTSYWVESGYAYIKRMSGNSNSGSMGTVNDWTCEQKFRIKDYYQESATNNTVYCYVVKNNIAYEASVELYFGPMSSNGTDFTFKMGFESEKNAVTREIPEVLRVNFQMFDFNNDKVPNFWENGITVQWYAKNGKDEIYFCNADGDIISNSEFTFQDNVGNTISDNKTIPTKVVVKANHFYIKYLGTKDFVPNYYVAEAFVTTDPTLGAGATQANHVRLSCQLLIPYRDNDTYTGIEGATHILYSSSGTNPEFYDGRYKLWKDVDDERVEETDITWKVHPTFALVQQPYYPKLGQGNKLIVPSTHVEGLSTQICIQAIGQNEKVLWSQPIVMMKDAYSSAMLNAWDGNLTIDNEYGTILSTMIGAGKKESDNSYSGVLMGDVKCAIDDITKIGLYGFNFGHQAFGWMVDGTGFIGKNGQGQIRFDGNNGTISSGVWRTSQGKIGMEIDLDGPTTKNAMSTGSTFKMKGLAGTISFDTSAKTGSTDLFVVQGRVADGTDSDGNPTYEVVTVTTDDTNKTTTLSKALNYKDMIKISVGSLESDGADIEYGSSVKVKGKDAIAQKSSFYLQSLNFEPGKKGTRLDLQNGKYTSYGDYGRVEIATSTNTFFRLADADNNVLFIIKTDNQDKDGDPGSVGEGAVNTASVNISSKYYLQSSDFDIGNKTGTRLDLQNGKYTSYGSAGYVIINSNHDGLFRIGALSEGYWNLMYVGSNNYYLQSLKWAKTSGTSKEGSRWDLANSSFKAYGSSGKIIIQPQTPSQLFAVTGIKDGNETTLLNIGTGSFYLQSHDYPGGNTGMKIDLSNGKLISKNAGGTITIDPSSSLALFKVENSGGKPLMNVGTDEYFIQSAEYEMSTTSKTGKGFKLDLKSGYINASDFKLFAKDTNGYIQIGTGNDFAIDVNGRFQVDWNGNTYLRKLNSETTGAILTVESGIIRSGNKGDSGNYYYELTPDGGTIGPWKITDEGIWAGTTIDDADAILYPDGRFKFISEKYIMDYDEDSLTIDHIEGESYFTLTNKYFSVTAGDYDFRIGQWFYSPNPDNLVQIATTSGMELVGGNCALSFKGGNIYMNTLTNGVITLSNNISDSAATALMQISKNSVFLAGGSGSLQLSGGKFYVNGQQGFSDTIKVKTYDANEDGFLTSGYVEKTYTFINGILVSVD